MLIWFPFALLATGILSGSPNPQHISTSYVERQNLNMRMGMRRFTRLTNAFSKKIENLESACALHFAYYDFCWRPGEMRITPAMAAGLTDKLMDWSDVVRMIDNRELDTKIRQAEKVS